MWLRTPRGNMFNMTHAHGLLAWSSGSGYVLALLIGKDDHIALTDTMPKQECRQLLAKIHDAFMADQKVFDLPDVREPD